MAEKKFEREYLSLKQLQSVSFDLLCAFDTFCRKYGIKYCLCGGTMLGAVRHRGFIPWDDDVDVMLLRSEYERLLALAGEADDGEHALVSLRDKTFARDYARYVWKSYGKEEKEVVSRDCPWLGVDIFPIDELPDSEEAFKKQLKDRWLWNAILITCSSPVGAGSTPLKRMVRNMARPFARAYGAFNAARKSEEICRRFEGAGGKDIGIVCGMYGLRERWPRDQYEPFVMVPFEGRNFPAPAGYDVYLTAIYGDYMSLPPEDERKLPHIRVWKQ